MTTFARFNVALLALCATTLLGTTTATAAKGGKGAAAPSYYSIEQDYRKCIDPLCGRYWVKELNSSTTTCFDGTVADACYVADIDWKALGVSEDQELYFSGAASAGQIIVSATLGSRPYSGFGKLGVLKVDDAWEAATTNPATGGAYALTQTGIVCAKAPCQNVSALTLNSATTTLVAPDFSAVMAGADDLTAAQEAMSTGDLLATGTIGAESVLSVTQFYLRVGGGECWNNSGCTASNYTKAVKNPNQCYCPLCNYQAMSLEEAQHNADSWGQHCAAIICPAVKCAAPSTVVCANGSCEFEAIKL